ncbi:MAG: diguanylate cyclase [Sulfurospirillaceae bacterium]|nr:diguanylate cyclase [Sulfurospirillaceae bacterium]
MRNTFLLTLFLGLFAYGLFFGYTFNAMQKEKSILAATQNKNLELVYRSVTQMYRVSIENYFKYSINQPLVLDILKKAKYADKKTQESLRVELYEMLNPLYSETLAPFGIRQFHFHTPDGHSFLRFHSPLEYGDPLAHIRPSIKMANFDKKVAIGFEGGKVYPGFRYVFPIINGQGEHLGSVELSLPYESIENELSKLLPFQNNILLMKKSIATDLVFEKHKEYFTSSPFSEDFVFENAKLSSAGTKTLSSSVVKNINQALKEEPSFQEKLQKGKHFSVLLIKDSIGYVASFHAIYDISNQLAGYGVSYGEISELTFMQKRYTMLLVLGFIAITLLMIAVYFLLKQRMKEKHDRCIIEHLAYYDALTDLPNRKLLLDRLGCVVAMRNRNPEYGGLLFIDLDNFKTLNDTQGHDIGDKLLCKVATRFTTSLRSGDTVARFGGDEFVVLATKLGGDENEARDQLQKIGKKLLDALSQEYFFETANGKLTYSCTASIGGTIFLDNKKTIDEILKDADNAMYEVKKKGKNEVFIF